MEKFLEWLSNNPNVAVIMIVSLGFLVVSATLIYVVAFFQGREISFWPPKIGARRDKLKEEPSKSSIEPTQPRFAGKLFPRCNDPKVCIVRSVRDKGELEAIFDFPPDDKDKCIEAISQSGCLLEGHFRLVSGEHSARFIRFASILDTPSSREYFIGRMASLVSTIPFTKIIGPSGTAGGALADGLAHVLKVGSRTFPMEYDKRTFNIPPERVKELLGDRCLYVDDLITTGEGVISAINNLAENNITVVGVAVCFVRDKKAAVLIEEYLKEKGIQFVFVGYANLTSFTWSEQDCRLCRLVFSQDMN